MIAVKIDNIDLYDSDVLNVLVEKRYPYVFKRLVNRKPKIYYKPKPYHEITLTLKTDGRKTIFDDIETIQALDEVRFTVYNNITNLKLPARIYIVKVNPNITLPYVHGLPDAGKTVVIKFYESDTKQIASVELNEFGG